MSTEIGRRAEQAAADYLRAKGYEILAQNWRTRWCEIDLIVSKRRVVYFVEVKYRGNAAQGSGLDYITSRKLEQMHFAAEFWLARNQTAATDYRLAALEVTGQDYSITAWLDDI
jgi:uncharacterized protein (TIGR00252 family)